MQNQEFLNLPFDLYERYELLQRLGELFVGPGPAPRVLEVGGHYAETRDRPSLLSVVLPNAQCVVTGLDDGIGRQGYVRSRPFRLPFRDQSFDLVCALDVLERLQEGDRIPALAELLRVSKDGLYLSFRYSSDAQIEAERFADEFLERQRHERLANSLPDRNQIETYLRQTGFRPVSFGHGNSDVWLLMTLTSNSLQIRAGEEAVRLLNRRFNSSFAPRDFEEPTSRACVLLSKRKAPYQLEAIRESLLKRDEETLRSEEILHLCELLLLITTKSGDHDLRTKAELRAQAEHMRRLEGQVGETARSIQEVRESRIWRAFVGVGGLLLSFSRTNRKRITAEPAPPESPQATPPEVTPYNRWIAAFEKRDESQIQLRLSALRRKPVISVLIAACGAKRQFLEQAVDSVRTQSYPRWELCIAGDVSGLNATLKDDRINIQFRKGLTALPAALTIAAEAAAGEYLVLLDHDARISKDALLEIAEAIDAVPDADFIYSDHDCMDETGRRADPFFKPDWSPDLLLSQNYVSHLVAFRKELLSRAGGFRDEFDGSWEYDLVLRLTQKSARVVHIPKILCHLRNSSSRPVLSIDSPAKAKRAIEDHLQRAAVNASVERGRFPGLWRVRYARASDPRVSILIPSGGSVGALETCLDGLATRTEYKSFEVVVIDNSKQDEIERLVRQWMRGGRAARYIDQRSQPFNYSVLNNAAARQCDSPLLLFLNDDTSPIAPEWLTALVELGARPEVGAVGAKLLYPNGQIQHAGVILGIIGCCGHAFQRNGGERHYFDLPDVIRNISAVTGACMLVPSKVFQEAGGFNEEKLPVAFNDIDLCLKIGRLGYRVLYTPYALLNHFEAFSKTGDDLIPTTTEIAAMWTRWPELIRSDPFYSPNLALDRNDYAFRPAPLDPEPPVPLTLSQAP